MNEGRVLPRLNFQILKTHSKQESQTALTIYGWLDGYMDRWINGQMNRCYNVDRQIDERYLDRWINEQMNRCYNVDRQMDRWIDEQML